MQKELQEASKHGWGRSLLTARGAPIHVGAQRQVLRDRRLESPLWRQSLGRLDI